MAKISSEISGCLTDVAEAAKVGDLTVVDRIKEKTSTVREALEKKIGPFWAGVVIGCVNTALVAYVYSKVKGYMACPERFRESLDKDLSVGQFVKVALATVFASATVASLMCYFNLI